MPDDIAAAARRVAAQFKAAKRAGHTDVALRMDEVIALLPVLDAVVAGRGDAGRVERLWDVVEAFADMPPDTWGLAGCIELQGTLRRLVQARAAIALADAERAAERDDAGRVERWARGLCEQDGRDPDKQIADGVLSARNCRPQWHDYRQYARAAIALADAEKVAVRYVEPVFLKADEIRYLEPGLVPRRAMTVDEARDVWPAETAKAPRG